MIRCPFCDPVGMSIELIFSAIVIILCLLIYSRTKELYTITKHKGISYFRTTFIFFALAFLFRLVFHLFAISGMVFDFRFPRYVFGPLPLLVTTFFSTIAIFYLILSMIWKRVSTEKFLGAAYISAFALAVLVFIFHSPYVLVLSQLILMFAALFLAYVKSRHSKGFSRLFIIYALLFVGWLTNILVMSPRLHLSPEIKSVFYIISTVIFAVIFYKVYRWTK